MNFRHLHSLEKRLTQCRKEKVDPVTRIFWDLGGDVIMKMAVAISSKGDSVLDVGCGGGNYLIVLSKIKRECFGLDPLRDTSLLEAQKNTIRRNVKFFLGQSVGEFLPFRSEIFNVVLCISTLQHVNDQIAVLHEVKRVLQNGGTLLVSVPTTRNIHSLFRETKLPDYFTRGFNARSFREILVKSGFRILHIRGCGFFPPLTNKFFAFSYHLFGKKLTCEMMKALDIFANIWISASSSLIASCQKEI